MKPAIAAIRSLPARLSGWWWARAERGNLRSKATVANRRASDAERKIKALRTEARSRKDAEDRLAREYEAKIEVLRADYSATVSHSLEQIHETLWQRAAPPRWVAPSPEEIEDHALRLLAGLAMYVGSLPQTVASCNRMLTLAVKINRVPDHPGWTVRTEPLVSAASRVAEQVRDRLVTAMLAEIAKARKDSGG